MKDIPNQTDSALPQLICDRNEEKMQFEKVQTPRDLVTTQLSGLKIIGNRAGATGAKPKNSFFLDMDFPRHEINFPIILFHETFCNNFQVSRAVRHSVTHKTYLVVGLRNYQLLQQMSREFLEQAVIHKELRNLRFIISCLCD